MVSLEHNHVVSWNNAQLEVVVIVGFVVRLYAQVVSMLPVSVDEVAACLALSR